MTSAYPLRARRALSLHAHLAILSLGLGVSLACYDAPTSYTASANDSGSFSLAVSTDTLDVQIGASARATLRTIRTGGFVDSISLSVADRPNGLLIEVERAAAPDSATLTFTPDSTIDAGVYVVVVQARSARIGLRERRIAVRVLAPAPRPPIADRAFSGNHNCVLTTLGAAYCWGSNAAGQLGNGRTNFAGVGVPTAVVGGHAFSSLSIGKTGATTCGVRFDGAAFCWGNNAQGQLGDGTLMQRSSPARVRTDLRFSSIAVGASHVCGITFAHDVACWGTSPNGAFGDGTTGTRLVPELLTSSSRFLQVVAGEDFTCALSDRRLATCWGQGRQGQLGDGLAESHTTPITVTDSIEFTSLVAAQFGVCGLTENGRAYCWGNNDFGTVGDGTLGLEGGISRHRSPSRVLGVPAFSQISAGYETMCGIGVDRVSYCWGYNAFGEVGDGSFEHRAIPTPIDGALEIRSLAAGTANGCGVTSARAIVCWGDSLHGALGDDNTVEAPRPSPVLVHWPIQRSVTVDQRASELKMK